MVTAGDRWVISLAAVAVVVAFVVRDRLGMVLGDPGRRCRCSAFVYEPQSVIWNERLVPFWFISIHLIVGWLFAYPLSRWVENVVAESHTVGERADEAPTSEE